MKKIQALGICLLILASCFVGLFTNTNDVNSDFDEIKETLDPIRGYDIPEGITNISDDDTLSGNFFSEEETSPIEEENHPQSLEPLQSTSESWQEGESIEVTQEFDEIPLRTSDFSPPLMGGIEMEYLNGGYHYDVDGIAFRQDDATDWDHNVSRSYVVTYPSSFLNENRTGYPDQSKNEMRASSFYIRFDYTNWGHDDLDTEGEWVETMVEFDVELKVDTTVYFEGYSLHYWGSPLYYHFIPAVDKTAPDQFASTATVSGLINSSMIFRESAKIRLLMRTIFDEDYDGSEDALYQINYMQYFDYSLATWNTFASVETDRHYYDGLGHTGLSYIDGEWFFEYILLSPNPVVSHVRSQKNKVDSDTYLFKVSTYCLEYGNTITLSIPEDWEFSHSNPIVTSSISGNDLVVTSTVMTLYDFYFAFSSPKHYSAVYRTTPYYFINYGFEGGWYDDWANTSSDEWTGNRETGIVFDGAFALNMTSPSSISTYCSLDSYVYPAEYIFTFAYYRTTTSPIYFYWWENDAWQYEALETDTNRWIRHVGRYNITGDTGGYNIAFVTSTTNQNIIIDEFDSWQANGQVRTTGYYNGLMETGMFATIRNIDLYDNPAVPYHPVNVYLRDRTADAQIIGYSMYADEYGRIQVSFVLPDTNQMNEMEYTFRVQSLISGEYVDSHFTPIPVNYYDYFMVENYTNFGLGGIDFTEVWDDGATYYQSDDYQSCGYNQLNPSSATVSDFRIKFYDLQDIDASYYTHLRVTLRTNVSDLYVASYDQEGNLIGQAETLPQSTGELDWYTVTWNISADADWTGTENGTQLYFDEVGGDGLVEENNFVWIDQIRLYHIDDPWLVVTATYGYLTTEYNQFAYYVVVDGVAQDYVFDLDPFLFDLSEGSHEINVTPFLDLSRRWLCYIPSDTLQITYDVAESGIMKLIYHDQSGNLLQFDQFKTYIDSIRLYDNYVYFLNVSLTFNLTICDLFDNLLYQNTTEDFENFKEIQLTLYSIKVQNLQENPIWLNIIRDSKTFSEWIYPYEIVKYRLEAATYDFKIYYCDSLAADLGAFSTNGSWFNFEYAVSSDSALMITGNTIQDVFDNVLSLTQDLDSVNTSMHIAFEDQSQNFTLQFTATNQNITFMLGNSSLIIDTINSNFTAILGDLILLDSHINGNFTTTFLAIAGNTTLLVNQLNSNFTDMQGLIISNNTVLYTQLVHTLADLAELKGLYRVHFSVIDGAGIGLPFETVLLNVNGSRQFDQDVYLSNNTYFEAEAFDWFDVSLWSDNFSITKRTEVNISIQLYWVLFENNGSYTSYLEIWRNNKLGVNITVAPDQTVSIRLTEGVYDYRVYYFTNDSQEITTKDPSIYSYGRRLLSIGKFAVSALMPTKINVSTPKIKLPLLDAIMAELTLVEIIANVILTVLGLAASYFVLNFIVRRAIGRHAQDPSYVPPREREDWLDQLEKKAGLQTDDEGLW